MMNVAEKPIEPKKTRVVHCKNAPYDIMIGRGTHWGNQWTHKQNTKAKYQVATRAEAIRCHKEWLLTQPEELRRVRQEMPGKRLGCWCKPLECHGDTYAWIADMPETEFQVILRNALLTKMDGPIGYKDRIPIDPELLD